MGIADTDHNLLFGLLALQNGLINQVQLVYAFQSWTLEKTRSLADHLVTRGDLDPDDRRAIVALVVRHLRKHGGVEHSLAAIPAGRSTRESLARVGGPELEATLARVGTGSDLDGNSDPDRTGSYAVGTATSDGQRFRVLRPHARGGLGAVFVALDSELHREVALKQILDHHADDPVSRQRFMIEAEITGGLEHPGIVPVYGLGAYGDGRPYYAMRFIRGDSLKEAIEQFHGDDSLKNGTGRPLELLKLLRRFLDICNAIDYAHSRGVLHRDIKPGNIIIGKHGETLVVDWGLAKAQGHADATGASEERPLIPISTSGSAETLPGSALGTPAYMSPEQAQGDLEHLGPRSDVYSLGATLYCLLTGKPPVENHDIGAVLRAVRKGEYPAPREIDPTIDRALEAVCLKAMALLPEDRYVTPKALADDVERWMADAPVLAWREPLGRRARRWARRNRSLMMAGSAAVVVALAGLLSVLAVQSRANARLRQANIDMGIANALVSKANTDLYSSIERERQRFDLAVEAIRRYHTGVSEDFLLKQDQFKDLRDRLLRDAVQFYQKLEGLLTNAGDTRSRRALGRAYEEVGELTDKIGSITEALAAHRKSLEVRRALAQEVSADVTTKADVGKSLIAIGILLIDTGHNDEGLSSFQEAHCLLTRLDGSGPASDSIKNDVARSSYWEGWTYYRTGNTQASMAAYEESRAIEAKLAAAHPEDVDYSRLLSWCYNDIGILLNQDGMTSQALVAFKESRRIKQKIADDHPAVPEYRRALAISHSNIGILLRETGHMAEALASGEAALELWQKVADANPSVTHFQIDLANGLNEVGYVLRTVGGTVKAKVCHERAVVILDGLVKANPTLSDIQERLVDGLKGLGATRFAEGRTADAVTTWKRAVATGERLQFASGEPLYFLAGCHALLGGAASASSSGLSAQQGQAELNLAMDTLHRSVAAGYRSLDWKQRDPDLDPLRARADFQLLIMDLSFPDNPIVP